MEEKDTVDAIYMDHTRNVEIAEDGDILLPAWKDAEQIMLKMSREDVEGMLASIKEVVRLEESKR